MNIKTFAPLFETLLEVVGSKKATIMILALFALADADSIGFESVPAKYRLAGGLILIVSWIVSQTCIDIFGKCELHTDKKVDKAEVKTVEAPKQENPQQ